MVQQFNFAFIFEIIFLNLIISLKEIKKNDYQLYVRFLEDQFL